MLLFFLVMRPAREAARAKPPCYQHLLALARIRVRESDESRWKLAYIRLGRFRRCRHSGSRIPGWVTKRNKSELFRISKLVRVCFLLQLFELILNNTAESNHFVAPGGAFMFNHIILCIFYDNLISSRVI